MSRNINVYNLDGSEHLTTFLGWLFDKSGPYDFPNEVQERLGIPNENQVFYDDQRKCISGQSFISEKTIKLGYRPSKQTNNDDDENSISSDNILKIINGSYSEVKIRNKFEGHEILENFNANVKSTYYDLKLFIEENLHIPVESQLILRRDVRKVVCYLEPDDEDFLINYMFDNERIPDENIVYLMVKELSQYIENIAGILKAKPISIYSQHGHGDTTKIITILPQEHIFTISAIKSLIEKQFGIPSSCQILYRNADKCRMQPCGTSTKSYEIADASLMPTLFHFFDADEDEISLYLTCDCKGDERSSQICKEYGIKILEVQIMSPSEKIIATHQRAPSDSVTFLLLGTVKSKMEEKYRIPTRMQTFYGTNFKVLHDYDSLWTHFGWKMVNTTCSLFLFIMKKLAYSNVDELCKQFDIPIISPEFVVKSLDDGRELHKMNIDQFKYENKPWFSCLTQEIKDKLKIPSVFQLLCLDKVVLYEDLDVMKGMRNWKDLYFRDGVVREAVVFNLTFLPTMDDRVQAFCEKFDIPTLKTLKVKFLTSEIDIDLRNFSSLKSVLDVKDYIADKKKIPIFGQEVFVNGQVSDDSEKLVDLFVREYKNGSKTTLKFNIFVKAADVKIVFTCRYAERLRLPNHLTISSSDSVRKLKEEIGKVSGLKTSQLQLDFAEAVDASDDTVIQDLLMKNGLRETKVSVHQLINVCVIDRFGNTSTRKEYIDNDDFTVIDVVRLNLNTNYKRYKLTGQIPSYTFLYDLGSDDMIEVEEIDKESNSRCEII